jgi:hypothetical protein
MEYKTLKVKDKRPEGYEYSDKGRNNWRKGSWVGAIINAHELELFDFRAPITKRRVKIERTPHRGFDEIQEFTTYNMTTISEVKKLAEESQKLSKRITEISIEINKILKGRI